MDFQRYVMFPFKDGEWIKKIIIGCFVSIVPVLNLLTLGYFVECMRLGISRRQALPDWDKWGDYLREGLMAFLIAVVYLIIPVLLTLPLLAIPVIGVFLISVISFIVGMMIPVAIANYCSTNSFIDALNIRRILAQISEITTAYIPAYLLAALVFAVGSTIVLILPHLAFLGILLLFYSGVVFFNYLGTLLGSIN